MPVSFFRAWRVLFALHFVYYTIATAPYFHVLYGERAFAFPFFTWRLWDMEALFLALYWLRGIAAVCIMAGWHRRLSALALYAASVALYARNPLAVTPEIYYLHWLALMLALVPAEGHKDFPKFSRIAMQATWVVVSASFLRIGAQKLLAKHEMWINGTALYELFLEGDIRDPHAAAWLTMLPLFAFKVATWTLLLIQLSGFAAYFFPRARALWWAAAVFPHALGFVFLEIQQVSSGMTIALLFLAPFALSVVHRRTGPLLLPE